MKISLKNKIKIYLTGAFIGVFPFASASATDLPLSSPGSPGTPAPIVNESNINLGDNGYKQLGNVGATVESTKYSLDNALSHNIITQQIYDTLKKNFDDGKYLKPLTNRVTKTVSVYNPVTGETKVETVLDSEHTELPKWNYNDPDIGINVYNDRVSYDYVEHTIAEVNNNNTMDITDTQNLSQLPTDWYTDDRHMLKASFRKSNLYTAENDSIINFLDGININSPNLPFYDRNKNADHIPLNVAVGIILPQKVTVMIGNTPVTVNIESADQLKTFNNKLIDDLQTGKITINQYNKYISTFLQPQYLDIQVPVDPNKNDPIYIYPKNVLFKADNNSTINIGTNNSTKTAEILVQSGLINVASISNKSTLNNYGKISVLQNSEAETIIAEENSTINNYNIINLRQDYDNNLKFNNDNYTLNTIDILLNHSKFINQSTGIINANAAHGIAGTSYNDTAGAPTIIMASNSSSVTNNGNINYGTMTVDSSNNLLPESSRIGILLDQSSFTNNGIFSIGKAAQATKSDSQGNIKLIGNENNSFGIAAQNGSTINNYGTIQSGSLVENYYLMAGNRKSELNNYAQITVAGSNNAGIYLQNSDFTNYGSGIIDVSGTGNKGILAKSTAPKDNNKPSAYSVVNRGRINVNGGNSFTSVHVRNYGISAGGSYLEVTNKGNITLNGEGDIGILVTNGSIAKIDTSDLHFIDDSHHYGNQIGYFAYGIDNNTNQPSNIIFSNDVTTSVDTNKSTFVRVENGATVSTGAGNVTVNLNGEDSIGIHIAGIGTSFSSINNNFIINQAAKGSIGILATNSSSGIIDSNFRDTISADNAIFAKITGKTYNINGTIDDYVAGRQLANITSYANLKDGTSGNINSSANNVIGYLVESGGALIHKGNIQIDNLTNPIGIEVNGGLVQDYGTTVVNGTGINIIGKKSVYNGLPGSSVTASNGKAAVHINPNASGYMYGIVNIRGQNTADGLLIDPSGSATVESSTISATGTGYAINQHSNKTLKITRGSNIIACNTNAAINVDTDAANITVDHSTIKNTGAGKSILLKSGTTALALDNGSTVTSAQNGKSIFINSGANGNISLNNGSIIESDLSGQSFLIENNAIANITASKGSEINGNIITKGISNLSLDTGSRWNVKANGSNITNLSLHDHGILDLTKYNYIPNNMTDTNFITLTIDKNLTGSSSKNDSGSILMNTTWQNDGSSNSDKVNINGSASGYVEVAMKNNALVGSITKGTNNKYSTSVVHITNPNGQDHLYGFADTQYAGQALLTKKDDNNYVWMIPGTNIPKDTTALIPELPGFVETVSINRNIGYSILGTLHQRVGEQQFLSADYTGDYKDIYNNGDFWVRQLGESNNIFGKSRFAYSTRLWGFQLGHDLFMKIDKDNNSIRHIGIFGTYAISNNKFRNEKHILFNKKSNSYSTENIQVGTGHTTLGSLGFYNTYYKKDGAYMDLVANALFSHNEYNSIRYYTASNNDYGLTISAEIGKPYNIDNKSWVGWKIEPQVQLIYQRLNYASFDAYNGGYNIHVKQGNDDAVLGRLGFRLTYSNPSKPGKTIYFTGNLLHDFTSTPSIDVGLGSYKENYHKTSTYFGFGWQTSVGKSSYFYGDVSYEHSLGGSDHSFRENLGFRLDF